MMTIKQYRELMKLKERWENEARNDNFVILPPKDGRYKRMTITIADVLMFLILFYVVVDCLKG